MPKTYMCPYFKAERDLFLFCEGGRVVLPDRKCKREFVQHCCASLNGWESCSIAAALTRFYERTL